jgi:hypothetical protein
MLTPMSNSATLDRPSLRDVLTTGYERSPLSTESCEAFVMDKEVYSVGQPRMTFLAMGFVGRRGKPSFNFRFTSATARDQYVAQWIESNAKAEALSTARKQALAAERAAFDARSEYKVGDVIHHSWGWEQTQCDFYKVVSVPGKATLEIIAIDAKDAGIPSKGSMSTYLLADSEVTKGEAFRVRVTKGGVGLKYGHASKWDGRPEYYSWYA